MTTTRARRIANAIIVGTFGFQVCSTALTIVKADYSGKNSFDLVYALSVFTHLPADLQLGWRDERSAVLPLELAVLPESVLKRQLKALDKGIEIREIVLQKKSGGKSGEYRRKASGKS